MLKKGIFLIILSGISFIIMLLSQGHSLGNGEKQYILPGLYCIYLPDELTSDSEESRCGNFSLRNGEKTVHYEGVKLRKIILPKIIHKLESKENNSVDLNILFMIFSLISFVIGWVLIYIDGFSQNLE